MYCAFFKIRLCAGLQYRAAAIAGMTTQVVWGMMEVLLYQAFYETNPAVFPMDFRALMSYIWLQQAFLTLFFMWTFENEIFQMITGGNVAYELCRPTDLYTMWFTRNIALRLSKAILRSIPVLLIAVLLPEPYGLGKPAGLSAFFWFAVTSVLSLLVVVAFTLIIYISAFYTIQANGIRILAASVVEFLSGATIPLPFLPDGVRRVVELLPFASMQNVPFRVYGGDIAGADIYEKVALQLFWFVALVLLGKLLLQKALHRVTVQGG